MSSPFKYHFVPIVSKIKLDPQVWMTLPIFSFSPITFYVYCTQYKCYQHVFLLKSFHSICEITGQGLGILILFSSLGKEKGNNPRMKLESIKLL